jgi:hypothetical protein
MVYSGDSIQDTDGGVLRPISSVMRNRIINGAMVIDQRNAGAAISTGQGYAVDRWQADSTQASKISIQQNNGGVTPPAGFVNYWGANVTNAYSVTSSDTFSFRQMIEGLNVSDLAWGTANAKTVTLSFWVRSSLTGAFGGSLKNGANDRSYPFSYTISSANTWEQKSVTIAGDTSGTWLTTNGTGVRVVFNQGAGSNFLGTAGAWAGANYNGATGQVNLVATSGATWYITGVQLEVGTQATSFEYRQYGTELALCQRYFEKSYLTGVAPATSTNVGMASSYVPATGSTQLGFYIKFATTKRTTAGMTFYSGTGGAGNFSNDFAGTTNVASVISSAAGDSGTLVFNNAGSANFVGVHWVASAEL